MIQYGSYTEGHHKNNIQSSVGVKHRSFHEISSSVWEAANGNSSVRREWCFWCCFYWWIDICWHISTLGHLNRRSWRGGRIRNHWCSGVSDAEFKNRLHCNRWIASNTYVILERHYILLAFYPNNTIRSNTIRNGIIRFDNALFYINAVISLSCCGIWMKRL
jgi:hypothetical protein